MNRLNILHLLSNRKWTERAEPVTDLALAQRALGHNVTLVCGKWTLSSQRENSIEERARRKGIEPVVFDMDKHFRWSSAVRDIPRLRELIAEQSIDVVHAHLLNAHVLAAMACRKLKTKPLLIRSSYEPEGPERGLRSALLHRHYTDGLILICARNRAAILQRLKLAAARVVVIKPGIDLDFFNPDRPLDVPAEEFSLGPEHFVIGMVARIRSDRRVDLPVRAVQQLAPGWPNLRFLLIGHGEQEAEIRKLVEELGVSDKVVFGGYCRGDRLVAAYRAMDLLIYPAPGSDKSCRTVREAIASGVPVISARTGFLSELVEDGITGRFMEPTTGSVAKILEELHADQASFARMRSACLTRARDRFSLSLQAERTIQFYRDIQSIR